MFRLPPTYKTWRNQDNWCSVSLLWSIGPNPHNHLQLGRQLSRLFGHTCTCQGGLNTTHSCCHVQGGVIAICAPGSFRSTKKNEARAADIFRPDEQQPVSSGPPANCNAALPLQLPQMPLVGGPTHPPMGPPQD